MSEPAEQKFSVAKRVVVRDGFRLKGQWTRCSCDHALFDTTYPLCDSCVRSDVRRGLDEPMWDIDHFKHALAGRWMDRIRHWQDRRFQFNVSTEPLPGVLGKVLHPPRRRLVRLRAV